MRKVTETEYEASKAAVAEYASRHMQGLVTIDCAAINAHSTNVELYELERDMPVKFCAYAAVDNEHSHITTWTGEIIARVTREPLQHARRRDGRCLLLCYAAMARGAP
jgi:hypothetical protein